MTNQYVDLESRKIQLSKQLFNQRKKLGLTQADVAELLYISEKTYQRWESNGLSNINDILNVFRVLRFPTTEIIDFLGLPPVTIVEAEEKELCTYICNECEKMEDNTIERLLDILFEERLKRHKRNR